jgi:hypothetical protein
MIANNLFAKLSKRNSLAALCKKNVMMFFMQNIFIELIGFIGETTYGSAPSCNISLCHNNNNKNNNILLNLL